MVITESTASTASSSRVLELFAELLEYPRPGLAERARECRALIALESAEAATLLGQFGAFAERTPHSTLEEIFTATFDLNATCHPYVGYHMFGEAYKRSALLLELQNRYRERGFDPGVELPDHISVLLRFMALDPDSDATREIAQEALIQTLEPMTAPPETVAVDEGEEPPPEVFDLGDDYRRVLRALRLILEVRYGVPEALAPIPIPDPERLVS